MPWGLGEDIAYEQKERTREHRRRDEYAMIGRAEEQTDEVRYGHPKEGNRAGEGGDAPRDEAGDEDE